MTLPSMDLDFGGESYSDVIARLQANIQFEQGLKEPNTGQITLYQIELEHYQKLEKKRLQKIALRAKCASVFTPLKEAASSMQEAIKSEQYSLSSSVETFIQNAPDMIKGHAGQAFTQEVEAMRMSVVETSGMCEAIT